MARKKKTSFAEDVIYLASLLPWWIATSLAAATYILLNFYVQTSPQPFTGKTQDMARMMIEQLMRTGATVGQYLFPFLFLVAAASSFMARRRRIKLLSEVTEGDNLNSMAAVNAMSWQDFELVIGQWFRTQGYTVTEQGGSGPDGGIDLVLKKNTERFFVQCKQWRAVKVGVTTVRELYGVMAAHGATGGFVITAGGFTSDAKQFATGRNVFLIDGPALARMIQNIPSANLLRSPNKTGMPEAGNTQPRGPNSKTCPVCSGPMVERTAKRGSSAGKRFWGCRGYPSCRGTLPG